MNEEKVKIIHERVNAFGFRDLQMFFTIIDLLKREPQISLNALREYVMEAAPLRVQHKEAEAIAESQKEEDRKQKERFKAEQEKEKQRDMDLELDILARMPRCPIHDVPLQLGNISGCKNKSNSKFKSRLFCYHGWWKDDLNEWCSYEVLSEKTADEVAKGYLGECKK